jgi:putative PLP-dependent aminotransferase (TIGR04422 family)
MTDDYQWPYWASVPKSFTNRTLPKARLSALTRHIENFFEVRLGAYAVLVPSARAGLALLIRLHGLSRAHTIFAPKWSATCVWNTIGHFANPSSSHPMEADMVVAVHKWGQVTKAGCNSTALLVEDSVDSVFTSAATLFPNSGRYELLSLTKILGSMSGGLIVTRDLGLARSIRSKRHNGTDLARHQTYLKYLSARRIGIERLQYQIFDHAEAINTGLDRNDLSNILASLPKYDLNARTIERRLEFLRRDPRLENYIPNSAMLGRLPPVLPIPCASKRSTKVSRLMRRTFDFNRDTIFPKYQEAYLLPLHYGVSEARFRQLYQDLCRAKLG